ncbi:MAG TPA: PucR family transcriptional regulator ligand-binding domain-containing protein [Nocardioidaceae bacterium]|nr:PucR family transcriptional regulator ligand-binding domain-containing protein [Nocardioidaceae bacterium]
MPAGEGDSPSESEPVPMSVAAMLALPAFTGAEVLAGAGGLERVVRRANVMEVPDIVPWVRAEGLLLTTGYPLRESTSSLVDLVAALDGRGVSALAVKLHRYLDELPQAMLAEADRRNLPVILIPDSTGFDEVLTQVFTSVASERASLLERSEEVHRRLVNIVLTGGGVDEVTASVSALFGGLAMVTTADGRVISDVGDDGQREALRASSVFHDTGRFRTELVRDGVHAAEDLPGSYAVVGIKAGRIDHGRLVLFDPSRVMSSADLTILERAATVAAVSLTKEIAITAVESKYRGDFLRDVLAGRAGSAEDVVAHGRSLGWVLDRPVVVAVASLETENAPPMTSGYQGPLEVERFTAAWESVVSRRDPTVPVEGFAAEVVALLPVPAGADTHEIVAGVVGHVTGDGGGGRRPFATGVSRVVTSPDDLPAAYEQARKALLVGRQLHGSRSVTHFDDLGVFRLLSLIEDSTELESFVRETLGELAEGTTGESADLRETLQMLLDTNLNVAETARRLHFHYNTLRYRIGKLERMVGPFTTDPNLRLDLALALRVVAMREL